MSSRNRCPPPHLHHHGYAAPFSLIVHRPRPSPYAAAAAAAPYSYGHFFPLRYPTHEEIISRLQNYMVPVNLVPVDLPNPTHHQDNSNRDVYFHRHHSFHQEDETLILTLSDDHHNISDGNNFTGGTNIVGLSEETIVKNLRTRASDQEKIEVAPDYEQEVCVICQDDLCVGEIGKIAATLRCGHDYHAECIKNWLLRKNECPICKAKAVVVD